MSVAAESYVTRSESNFSQIIISSGLETSFEIKLAVSRVTEGSFISSSELITLIICVLYRC